MKKLTVAFMCVALVTSINVNPDLFTQAGSIGFFVPLPFVDITWQLEEHPSLLEAGVYFQ